MRTKFFTFLLLFCFLIYGYQAIAQNDNSTNVIESDFNSQLRPGVLLGSNPVTDVISAAWTTLATSPNALSRSCCVYARPVGVEYIYQIGGGSGATLRSIARYDIAANAWSVLVTTLLRDVSSGTAINDGDSVIYVFGGNSGTTTLGSTQKFNIGTGVVTNLATMPNLITDAAVVKYHDSLVYVIGGGTGLFGAGYINNVNVYNIKQNTYAAATAYPIAAGMMGFGIDGNKIISAAGWTGATGTPNAYKGVIDPSNHLIITWTAIPNYPLGPVTRSASYFVSKNGGKGIMFTGGAINGATLTNRTYFFDTDHENWDSTAPNSQARSNFKAAGRGDSVAWVVGGFTTVGVGTTERITFSLINLNISVTARFEGPFISATNFNDSVTIQLRNSTAPFAIVDSDTKVLSPTGTALFNFTQAQPGSYYIVVRSRFGIETWSANPIAFPTTTSYDFTTGVGQAFGSNMRNVSGTSVIYVGDVNQDGVVDGSDGAAVDNDAFNFAPGFGNTDLNWDGVVDGSDAIYTDNNSANFVGVIRPL